MEKTDEMKEGENAISAVILADGDFPTRPEALAILDSAPVLICCDGAFASLLERRAALAKRLIGEKRLLITGDGDSLPQDLIRDYSSIFRHVSEQDDNDLTKAMKLVRELCKEEVEPLRVAILGATGKREDHTIGNVSLLQYYRMEMGIEAKMYTDFGCFIPLSGDAEIPCRKGQQMSIFNHSCTCLESEGLRWPCRPFASLWEGTLNACTGSSVRFRSDGEYTVYLTYDTHCLKHSRKSH